MQRVESGSFPGNPPSDWRQGLLFLWHGGTKSAWKSSGTGSRCFFQMQFLKKVTIPKGVKKIGEKAFHGCNRLELLEILHDPEEIGPSLVNRNCMVRCHKGSKVDSYCEASELKREYQKVELEAINEDLAIWTTENLH